MLSMKIVGRNMKAKYSIIGWKTVYRSALTTPVRRKIPVYSPLTSFSRLCELIDSVAAEEMRGNGRLKQCVKKRKSSKISQTVCRGKRSAQAIDRQILYRGVKMSESKRT